MIPCSADFDHPPKQADPRSGTASCTASYRWRGGSHFSEHDFELSDELGFGRSTYVKLEYVYTRYGGYDYDDGELAGGIDVECHQVRAGVGFRF